MSQTSRTILGKYRHYKGNEYEVIAIGTHTESLEKYVVYTALYEPYETWIRPFDMFFETVTIDGNTIKRFEPLEGEKSDIKNGKNAA